MTAEKTNPEINEFFDDIRYLRQQVVDTRVDVLKNREAIDELANETICAIGEVKTELMGLKKPLNGRLTFVTIASVLAVGLAIACFIQM